MTETKPLSSRVALVTGASRGIGRATALALAARGAHVIATGRVVGALEELDDEIQKLGGAATLVPFNLTDTDAIGRLAQAIEARWGKLDILIGNAGVGGPSSPLGHVEPKAWDEVMTVNVTANWHLIRWLEPLLQKSDAGRAVFLTSGSAVKARAYRGPYSVSKAALEALARTFAAENLSTALKVNLVNPGPTRTKMRAQVMPGEDPETLPTADAVAAKIADMCLPGFDRTGMKFDMPTGQLLAYS